MNIEQIRTAAALEDGIDTVDQIAEMISVMELLQQATTMQREDVNRYIDLSCRLAIRLQSQTYEAQQRTIDYCGEYRAQVATLTKNNNRLAVMLFQQAATSCHQEGNA